MRQTVTMEASETRRSWSCMQEYAVQDVIEKTGFRVALFVLHLFLFFVFGGVIFPKRSAWPC